MPVRCPRCGTESPDETRFCPNCGLPLEARDGDTVVDQPPPDETGPVPVEVVRHEPRVVEAFAALARRIRESQLGREAARAVDLAQAGAEVTVESLKARSRAERELLRLRRHVRALVAARERLLRDLGDAVYTDRKEATDKARAEIAALDESIAEAENEMQLIITKAEERVRRVHTAAQPTQIETPSEPDIPEPYPPPGETDPPQQPDIPEPYPPPGELDPPQHPDIPEPYPPRPQPEE